MEMFTNAAMVCISLRHSDCQPSAIAYNLMLMNRRKLFAESLQLVQQIAPENLGELYAQMSTSPAKKYFLLVMLSCVGFIFIFGLFCGRVTRRTIALKNK